MDRAHAERLLAADALAGGAPPASARGFVVALHGRGADAASMRDFALDLAPDCCVLAPEAPGRTWYPQRFIAPLAANEPHLSRSLARVAGLLDLLATAGVAPARVALMGFSQGACLALETALRRPAPWGAVLGLAGGWIGPPGPPRAPEGDLTGARVLLACGDRDEHIPLSRVKETAALMRAMGADVDLRVYPGFGHGVNADGIAAARVLLARLGADAAAR